MNESLNKNKNTELLDAINKIKESERQRKQDIDIFVSQLNITQSKLLKDVLDKKIKPDLLTNQLSFEQCNILSKIIIR